ncbi:hypothetical protein BH09BAC3_BH09BAC3_09270 [soil metagenome]
MTKRDLFILVIKLLALYFVVATLFSALPDTIYSVYGRGDFIQILWSVVVFGIIIVLFRYLISNADKVVDLLRLDKGFADARIDLSTITASHILEAGVFVIGGLLLIGKVPGILSQFYQGFKDGLAGKELILDGQINSGIDFLNVVIGFLLITKREAVAMWLNDRNVS